MSPVQSKAQAQEQAQPQPQPQQVDIDADVDRKDDRNAESSKLQGCFVTFPADTHLKVQISFSTTNPRQPASPRRERDEHAPVYST